MPEELRKDFDLTHTVRALGSELYATQRSLRESRLALSSLARATEAFQRQMNETLAVYRGQRAWRLMLHIRVAYTRLVREGWRGRWEYFTSLLLPGRHLNLEIEQLVFPDLAAFIQPELDRLSDPVLAPALHPAVANPSSKPDVLILAIVDFETRFQRPQQIAAELARRGHRVFWVSPSRFLGADFPTPYETILIRPNLWELRLRGGFSDVYLGQLTAECSEAYMASLRQLYRDWAIADSWLLVQFPFWRRLASAVHAELQPLLLYDCMDEWDAFENVGAFARQEEPALVRAADLVLVTARRLVDKFARSGVPSLLVRNAADLDGFRATITERPLDGIPRPVVGFFGAIADWADLDLVEAVAKARPNYSFVFVGQVFGRDTTRLEALPNVHLLGAQPYPRIPAYLGQFDASIIPFVINEVTQATDPVKLYEYFTSGRPVVSTALSELDSCRDLVYIGHNPEDFALQLDRALAENDPDLACRRRQFAEANTWTHRVEAVEAAVRTRTPLVSILIATYNSADFIGHCLNSIARHTAYPNYEIVVVDAGSTDSTIAQLEAHAARDSRLRLQLAGRNLGFAGANNAAAALAQGEFLVFLNPDTLVTPGWLFRLRRHLDLDSRIGLVCAVTNFSGNETKINVDYTDSDGMIRFALERASEFQHLATPIPMAPLFAVMIRRALFESLYGLDERYQTGMFEDDDFSRRVRCEGLRIVAAEDCFIHHFGQGSFSRLSPADYQAIFERNRAAYEAKWGVTWQPHTTRPGVRPPFEEPRFQPSAFCREDGSPCPAP
jgi:GT2 family glycosyltransferase